MNSDRKSKRSRGRPSSFKPAIAAKICERLANPETLRAICGDETMPAKSTVMRWLAQHAAFRDQYARAREDQADAIAEEILEIADDAGADVVVENGKPRVDWENVNRSRLRVDARKWFAGKVAPKRYGDRVAQEISGPGGGPIRTAAARSLPLPPAEVSKAVAALVKKAAKQHGMKVGKGKAGVRRAVGQMVTSGEPLAPELYAALFAAGERGDE